MDKKDNDQPTMPLRNNGHEVEVVNMPGQTTPVLGYRYGSQDAEVDVRAQSTLQWSGNSRSPRHTGDQSVPIDVELNLRIRTTLSHEVPKPVRNELNNMHTESVNEGRKSESKPGGERVSVKIGF